MKQTVLLTGCAGFIGSNFVKTVACRADIKALYDFVIVDALTYAGNLENIKPELDAHSHLKFHQIDIRDSQKIHDLFKKYAFSGVINFAAESHVDRSIESPNIFVETNVLGTLNLLKESLALFEAKGNFKYLQISTDEVYGTLQMEDAPFTETTPLAPNSPYSASKASADLICRSFFETFKLPVVITRCSNNYGPLQVEEKFIPLMIKRALANEPLPIYGTGMNIRDWIYVDDHNEGVWKVFTNGTAGEVYNLGGASERQNLDVAKMILKALGKPESLLKFVTDRKGHDFRYAINFSKTQKELGWSPKVRFEEEGLNRTIEHYKKLWAK
ncbi:dTDP-glucose 4,6-dehydratase [Bdellovibrio bacteriovorus]|uniref:dTDP-glucose 4,6-dehydratase n=1 Tax=Bdellovibrio bacteriovorus TaxID=959 RepID=A0A150WKD5_BDEBC|nr:dTDP-glucose 4,6-dehydratase [Bdellovibrio bacteriovorus]KYG64045.1 dTDP-glucose 4,6-dehydratase [Bdellovibrio bacteriovorus]